VLLQRQYRGALSAASLRDMGYTTNPAFTARP